MKVVCVYTEGALYLIKNKIYDAFRLDDVSVVIKDNDITIGEYSSHRFEKLSDVRNKVIDKILEE